jgi:hypothetical protein
MQIFLNILHLIIKSPLRVIIAIIISRRSHKRGIRFIFIRLESTICIRKIFGVHILHLYSIHRRRIIVSVLCVVFFLIIVFVSRDLIIEYSYRLEFVGLPLAVGFLIRLLLRQGQGPWTNEFGSFQILFNGAGMMQENINISKHENARCGHHHVDGNSADLKAVLYVKIGVGKCLHQRKINEAFLIDELLKRVAELIIERNLQ